MVVLRNTPRTIRVVGVVDFSAGVLVLDAFQDRLIIFPVPLQDPLGTAVNIGVDKDGNEINLNDILGSDPDEIIDSISAKIQAGKLYDAISAALSERERTVIIWRYGLLGKEALPQREIARALGISRSYVSRIEKKALEKLRTFLQENQPRT